MGYKNGASCFLRNTGAVVVLAKRIETHSDTAHVVDLPQHMIVPAFATCEDHESPSSSQGAPQQTADTLW
jgi:hypothetical protein